MGKVYDGKCWCCKVENIEQMNFHCGHVVSIKNNGKNYVDNLRPICSGCNLLMGSQNMNEFMKQYDFVEINK